MTRGSPPAPRHSVRRTSPVATPPAAPSCRGQAERAQRRSRWGEHRQPRARPGRPTAAPPTAGVSAGSSRLPVLPASCDDAGRERARSHGRVGENRLRVATRVGCHGGCRCRRLRSSVPRLPPPTGVVPPCVGRRAAPNSRHGAPCQGRGRRGRGSARTAGRRAPSQGCSPRDRRRAQPARRRIAFQW